MNEWLILYCILCIPLVTTYSYLTACTNKSSLVYDFSESPGRDGFKFMSI